MSDIVDSKIKIRDYNSKIVDGKTLLGFELESKSSNNYGNKVIVKFLKAKKIVKKEEIEIPFVVGDGVFCVGKSFDFTDYDNIELELKVGIVLYQESFYPDIEFEIDKEKSNQKHLEYKIENNSSETLTYAQLSLLFYNRGELVCGTDVRLEKVLTKRPYYFVYDIPEEIEFTDIKTELMLPATNRYLFRSFYEEYLDYEFLISTAEKPVKRRPHEEFVDNSDELKKSLKEVKEERKEVNKLKTKKSIPAVFIAKSIIYLAISVAVGIGVYIAFMIVLVIFDEIFGSGKPADIVFYIVGGLATLITFAIKWYNNWYKFNDYLSVEEKEAKLKEYDDVIKQLEDAIKDLEENKDKYAKQYEDKNKEIDEFNKEMDDLDEKRKSNLAYELKEFEKFKSEYPKYRVIEKYDDVDMGFVQAAISQGAITWDSVEMYRKEARKEYDADVKFKEEIEELKRKNALIEAQNEAIKRNTEQQMLDARAMREQVAENARRHDALVMEQISQNEKLYRQRERYAQQVSTQLNDLKQIEYLHDRFPRY